jgi:glutamine amidotransferase
MCRLYALRANEATKVECTLVYAQNALLTQSRADLRGASHPDGWGIGFYENGLPSVERRDVAAFRDMHFSATAERVYVQTVVAHVRQATVGGPSLVNTHPFVYGHWTFAHNGTVRAFERVGAQLEAETYPELLACRRGSTDSELTFYWLLSRMDRSGIALDRALCHAGPLVDVIRESVCRLDGWCEGPGAEKPAEINFIISDGVVVVATRWRHTLYVVERNGVRDCDICGIPHVHHTSGAPYRAVVIASEPISDEPWQEVAEGGVVSVDGDVRMSIN